MTEDVLLSVAGIIVLGITAQWLAWKARIPAILLLLLFGMLAGPVTGLLNPDELLGDLLLPLVSLAVGIILFEGGLSLKRSELRGIGAAVRRLLTVGAAVTWILGSVAARYVLSLDWGLSLLLGAILVVTGPTVIGPILRHVRPTDRVSSLLRWEGIIIDPIGAALAVLVFEFVFASDPTHASTEVALALARTILVGGGAGIFGAIVLIVLLRRYWAPEYLENPLSLMIVVGAFVSANAIQEESGLLATTVMGLILANQNRVQVKSIIEFKEDLGVLLISSLFIILAARLQIDELERVLNLRSFVFVAILMLAVRPLAVYLSTIGSALSMRERAFVAWMAPRGIVAAAVSSVFALELTHVEQAEANDLVPITFLVIISTVTIYGLTAMPFARRLQISRANPQGVLILGAHFWARRIATVIQAQGIRVIVVDTNYDNIKAARMEGLETYFGSVLSARAASDIELECIGRLIALTTNDEVNSLAALRYAGDFGHREVYQLAPREHGENDRRQAVSKSLSARRLFGENVTHTELSRRFLSGAGVKVTPLTEAFGYDAFRARHGHEALPLFVIDKTGRLTIVTDEWNEIPKAGDTLISLVDEDDKVVAAQNIPTMRPAAEVLPTGE